MNWEAIFWLVAMVVFLAAEAGTVTLVSIWFAVGALAAMVAAVCHAPLGLQIAVFVAVSAVAVWLTRGKVQNRFNQNREATNADRVLGHVGVVQETVDNQKAVGQVKVDGAIWSARSVGGDVIPAGAEVVIRAIEGVKVMVEPVQ